ncbi:MAG TPA: phosphoserine transaminase [Acidimicrobiales bacterium]|nr:phosphoserine transaminase [Acidimicrobiales bacterium]
MTSSSQEIPDIRLPADLLPADGRFGSGPSKVRQDALEALVAAAPGYLGTSHRNAAVKAVVGRVRAGLTELFSLPDGYEVVLGNGGAASFWDVATFSLIRNRSQHAVYGAFSKSFAAGVKSVPHLEDPDVIEAEPGKHAEPQPAPGIDAYALIHNETSTGVAVDVVRPQGAADGALVLVDATSAAGGMRVNPGDFDAYYFSPQKCFGSEGGLWLALCSPTALQRAEELASERWAPRSLSLSVAADQSRKDQTYNTPALATLFLMADQIEWMLSGGGLEWAAARSERSSDAIYRWAEASPYAMPFVQDPAERSPVVCTVEFDQTVDASRVTKILRNNGIVDTEPYRGLGGNQLRVAVYPNVEPDDAVTLTMAIDHIVAAIY